MSNFKKILESLENGIVPDELNFNLQVQTDKEIDWEKVRYNTFKDYDYIKENLIPKCLHKLQGIDLIIEDLQKNSLSPLEEIELRTLLSKESKTLTEDELTKELS